jgi:hypothetical protein
MENRLYSVHFSQVAGLDRLYHLARQHSYILRDIDELQFTRLPPSSPLYAQRAALDSAPEEAAMLEEERYSALSKRNARPQQEGLVSTHGDTRSSTPMRVTYRISAGHVAFEDRETRLAGLIRAVSDYFGAACPCRGDYWYPRGGFRAWHTNKYDPPGWRLYIVDVDVGRRSFFRVKNPDSSEFYTLWDQPGTFNFFLIDPLRVLWHCIRSFDANRWSKGFLVPHNWLDTVLSQWKRVAGAKPPPSSACPHVYPVL